MKQYDNDATSVWQQYRRGVDYLTQQQHFTRCDECFRFFSGDQWYGLKTAGERPPSYNIIRPIVEYKQATVAQNGMSINYSTMNFGDGYADSMAVCEKLNNHALKTWERLKLEKISWDMISDACIAGDSFAYFYDADGQIELDAIDSTNLFLSDEQEPDIQRQRYILIAQRLFADEIKEIARANGISEDEIALIQPDEETEYQMGDASKTELSYPDEDGENSGKCVSILKLWKQDGTVHICRSTKQVIYQPDTAIDGMCLYPIAQYSWNREKGSARGIGEVWCKIPNQIEINKSLVRLLTGIKQYAFPHIVYDNAVLPKDAVTKLSSVGTHIGMNTNKMQKVSDTIQYLQPAQINPLAREIVTQMVSTTRELAGAGEAVTGQINPEQASGAAIIAVRDAAALPLNGQIAAFRQFVEDIARIWYDMWVAYHPNGMDVVSDSGDDDPTKSTISAAELETLKIDVRVDVSPDNPYSKYAQEQCLQNLFAQKTLTFEEYVKLLDDNAVAPKAKLQQIVDARKAQAMKQAKQMLPSILSQLGGSSDSEGAAQGMKPSGAETQPPQSADMQSALSNPNDSTLPMQTENASLPQEPEV